VAKATWRDHQAKHGISSKKNKLPHYLGAKIQSFHHNSNHRLNFAIPALDPSPATTKPYAAGVSTLLASQLRKLMCNPCTGPKDTVATASKIQKNNRVKLGE
jgi:hypothetical protein